MFRRQKILLFLPAATATCALAQSISLDEGVAKENRDIGGRLTVSYGGGSKAVVHGKGVRFVISAKPPAMLTASPDGRYILHDYGDGSGQMGALAVYRRSGKPVNIRPALNRIMTWAKARGCRARQDEVSIVFDGWQGDHDARVHTEDFTRKPGCEALFRKWTLRLGGTPSLR